MALSLSHISPRILSNGWGKMDVEALGSGKDFKLWPGGGRSWDWTETGTDHAAGIQKADVVELVENGCTIIVLTRGAKPLLFARRDAEAQPFTPFTVEARDTTGAGDSFRTGLIYGMLQGYEDARLVETASAVAALVSRRVPGVLRSPTVAELEGFLDVAR